MKNLTKSFVEILKQKLSVGSSRSILLNAIPGKLATRLALNDLDHVDSGLGMSFLKRLISEKSFNFNFSVGTQSKDEEFLKKLARINKRLSSIKFDCDDYNKEHGIETFGFGFPLLVRKNPKDATKFIAAPLFIYQLKIDQSFNKLGEWVITRNGDAEIRLNEVLYSFLESEEHIKIPIITEEMLEDGLLDKTEIEQFCQDLLKQLNESQEFLPDWKNLHAIPEMLTVNDLGAQNTKIIWNGVFGLYKSPKQNLLKELGILLENFDSTLNGTELGFDWQDAHSPMTTDPSQNGVLRSLSDNKNVVIQGPPGTGKSQTLTAIISSALANKKKVLVVCEKRTALEVLKANLEKLIPSSNQFVALIEDVTQDRAAIVQTVRNRTADFLVTNHQLQLALKDDIKKFEDKAGLVERQYGALRVPIWKNHTWPDLVSQWLGKRNSEADIAKLFELQRIFQKQNLSDDHFESLYSKIEEGGFLFSKIANGYSALSRNLKVPGLSKPGYEREVAFVLKDSAAKLNQIHAEIETLKDAFRTATRREMAINVQEYCTKIKVISDILDYYSNQNIDIIRPPFKVKLGAHFFKKYKIAIQQSVKINSILYDLNTFWTTHFNNPFNTDSLSEKISLLTNDEAKISAAKSTSFLNGTIVESKNELFDFGKWKELLSELKTVHTNLSEIIHLETVLNFESKIDTVLRLISMMQRIVNETILNETILRDFFAWKAYEQGLSENERQWADTLMNSDPQSWTSVLKSAWLYYKLMTEDKQGHFPIDDSSLTILRTLGLKIQKQQKEVIGRNVNEWFLSGQKRIKDAGLQLNQIFNMRGSKGTTRNSLRKIVNLDREMFSDFFPVMMVNPGTCSSLLPLVPGMFDIVIFDEASQLRIEDTFAALLRGRQAVVSGDSQQMPPSSYFESSRQTISDDMEDDDEADDDFHARLLEETSRDMAQKESLLEFAIDAGFKETYLDMHYRSRHPDLIEFSNTCFYNSRLVPMPEKSFETPIFYKNVNGLNENRVNNKEAEEIIRILKDEVADHFSVGIATFNLDQRNLILTSINNYRIEDATFSRKMEKFEQNGFFVKNLENIQGDERDIILLSTTFGVKTNGKFLMNFGPITQRNGYRLLNVIITRAKHKVFVITSIPEVRIPEFKDKLSVARKVDGGTGLLAYLAYAKAVNDNNKDERNSILEFIRSKVSMGVTKQSSAGIGLTESPFEEEVFNWLSETLPPERIKLQYKCGGFRIDMVVTSNSSGKSRMLAIECDGAAYHSTQLAWHYDMYRQEQLEQHGFTFHRIWSTNWWRNPEEEFRKLMNAVETLN